MLGKTPLLISKEKGKVKLIKHIFLTSLNTPFLSLQFLGLQNWASRGKRAVMAQHKFIFCLNRKKKPTVTYSGESSHGIKSSPCLFSQSWEVLFIEMVEVKQEHELRIRRRDRWWFCRMSLCGVSPQSNFPKLPRTLRMMMMMMSTFSSWWTRTGRTPGMWYWLQSWQSWSLFGPIHPDTSHNNPHFFCKWTQSCLYCGVIFESMCCTAAL